MIVQEVAAIIDVVVRIYGDCGHAIEQPPRREALKAGEQLVIDFARGETTCKRCGRR